MFVVAIITGGSWKVQSRRKNPKDRIQGYFVFLKGLVPQIHNRTVRNSKEKQEEEKHNDNGSHEEEEEGEEDGGEDLIST